MQALFLTLEKVNNDMNIIEYSVLQRYSSFLRECNQGTNKREVNIENIKFVRCH